jgi:hypothetical protein
MNSPHRVVACFGLALYSACGTGPYFVPTPTSDAQSGEMRTDSLIFRAATHIRDEPRDIVQTEITVINSSQHLVTLLVPGGCPVIFQLLTSPPPGGREVWDSRKTRSSMGCALSLLVTRISRGESRVFVRQVEKAEILGDSLPPGRYFVRSQLDLDPVPITLYAGELTLSR